MHSNIFHLLPPVSLNSNVGSGQKKYAVDVVYPGWTGLNTRAQTDRFRRRKERRTEKTGLPVDTHCNTCVCLCLGQAWLTQGYLANLPKSWHKDLAAKNTWPPSRKQQSYVLLGKKKVDFSDPLLETSICRVRQKTFHPSKCCPRVLTTLLLCAR